MRRWRTLGGLMLALLLGACGSDMSDLRTYVAEVKARKSSDIEPIPEIRPYKPFTYRPGDRREPFTPVVASAEGQSPGPASGVSPDMDRPREPLEAFPLDAMRMQGTLSAGGHLYALIRDPDGIVHRVTRGEHMGQNYGEIVAIRPDEVELVEIVPDGMGGYMKRSASLALSENE